MKEFTARMGEDGRVVIPALFRHQLNFKAGEELIFQLKDDELHIFSLKHSLSKAQKIVKKYAKNQNLVAMLKQLREEDNK